jgi:hypothetical protein
VLVFGGSQKLHSYLVDGEGRCPGAQQPLHLRESDLVVLGRAQSLRDIDEDHSRVLVGTQDMHLVTWLRPAALK